MDESSQLAGRFLPSKVYARWKWTVRFGLFGVPLILFLVGGIVLYLTPSKYQSKTVFEYRGSRTPAEAAALLKSRNVLMGVCESLQLHQRWDYDKETTGQILGGITETQVDPASGQIEVTVTHTEKESARDIAADLPKALDRYEATLARTAITRQLEALRLAIRNGEDKAEIRRKDLLQLISVRGEHPTDTASQLDIAASRIEWEQECRRVADNKNRLAELDLGLDSLGKFVTVHTDAVMPMSPTGKKSADPLGEVSLEALGYGLLFALLVPYLFELACPFHRLRIKKPVRKTESPASTDEWSGPPIKSDLVRPGVNG